MITTIPIVSYIWMIFLCITYKKVKKFNRVDWLFFLRHLIMYTLEGFLFPFLFFRLNWATTIIIVYFITIIIITVFFKISKGKSEESKLLNLANKIFKKKKKPVASSLFLTDPYLFTIFYKDNFCEEKNKKDKKFLTLSAISSFLATIFYGGAIYFSNWRF